MTRGPSSRTPRADETPLPPVASADARMREVWCTWLGKLATDAEAALSASLAYRELDAASRERWLSALEQDVERIDVPRVAVYAPLLAVESDPTRRMRIVDAIGPGDAAATPRSATRALRGAGRDGTQVAAVVSPLYLDFVQVLACGFTAARGFLWVKHDPIVGRDSAPKDGDRVEGVAIESTPLAPLVDELAVAVLSHRRNGGELPEALRIFADLFSPHIDGSLRES